MNYSNVPKPFLPYKSFIFCFVVAGICFGQTTWKETVTQNAALPALNSITYANNQFVAVGNAGPDGSTILTSLDGVLWAPKSDVSFFSALNSVTYGNSQYVAVGMNILLTSQTGSLWTSVPLPTISVLNSITYADSLFVAVGHGAGASLYGMILTSPDGKTWTPRNQNTNGWLNSVAYGNNMFVAVGDTGVIFTSPDGLLWSKQTSGTTFSLGAVAYGDSQFVTAGFNPYNPYSSTVLTSRDGVTWAKTTKDSTIQLKFITYCNNQFIAAGNGIVNGLQYNCIFSSNDTKQWTIKYYRTRSYSNSIAFGKTKFVSAGWGGQILTSDADVGIDYNHEVKNTTSKRMKLICSNNSISVKLPPVVGDNLHVGIIALTGKTNYSAMARASNGCLEISSSKFSAGIHVITITDNNRNTFSSMVILKK